MVGRGWWLVVWSVCVAGPMCVVCGGSGCQQGQEYYSSQQGRCLPCTRCHDPLVVKVPCYVYRDAVCAPASQFLLAQPHVPALPTIPAPTPAPALNHTREVKHTHGHRTSQSSRGKDASSSHHKHSSGHRKGKNNSKKRLSDKHSHHGRSHITSSQDSSKRKRKGERHHGHRQSKQWRGHHRAQNQSMVEPEQTAVISDIASHNNGARNAVRENDASVVIGNESLSQNISVDASSDNYLQQLQTVNWESIFFLAAVIVISICLLVLTIVILSHLRNLLAQQKLKRVGGGVRGEEGTETNTMEQLLSSNPPPEVHPVSRGVVTYVRATRPTTTPASHHRDLSHSVSSHPASSHPTIHPATPVESEQITGQGYPPIPFTMDRLLEQRRVLGPASSLDTNLYVESWQQQDGLGAGHYLCPSPVPVTRARRTFLREAVSVAPSPTPVRTYRPVSASASPVMSTRNAGWPRGRVRGGGGLGACVLSRSTGGFVMRDCVSSLHT